MTAEPGPWRNERTPYLAGIMDATAETGVESVTVLKCVQVGFSEALRNLIGYWVDHDPGPAMFVMPSQASAEEMMDERVRPLIHETPALKAHASPAASDNRKTMMRLDTMALYMSWAGSPQALASRPIRYLAFDEIDKYPPFSGKEADPISLGEKRLTTYGHRARAIKGSTPTTRMGAVWRAWEACTDRRRFHVPCPCCGHKQPLVWSNVRFGEKDDSEDREMRAERVEAEGLARYECSSCRAQWTNEQKNAAVRKGKWLSDEPGASNRRVGFHLNSIYSPWVSMSKLAGEWLRAQNNPPALMDFTNSRLAEPFEERMSSIPSSAIGRKAEHAGPAGVVPDWAGVTLATADVQKDRLYLVVRAWGHGYRSQLVFAGMVANFDELANRVFGAGFPSASGELVTPAVLGIDCGYRDDEVYAFCQRDPARLWPLMGDSSHKALPVAERRVKEYGVIRRNLRPDYWKDVLHGYIASQDETQWLPHAEPSEDYCRQLASEHKVYDHKAGRHSWELVSAGRDNHFWDCEYMQCALAQLAGVAAIPSPEQQRQEQRDQQQQANRPRSGGWATGHRGRWG